MEHSRDFRRIRKLYPHDMDISQDSYYLIERMNGEDQGVWFFHPYDDGMMIHANFKESFRGKLAADSARNAFKWIFEHTATNVIYANINNTKRHVQMLACAVGFSLCYKADTDRLYRLKAA